MISSIWVFMGTALLLAPNSTHAEEGLEKFDLRVESYRISNYPGSWHGGPMPLPWWRREYVIADIPVQEFAPVDGYLVGTTSSGEFFIISPPVDEPYPHPAQAYVTAERSAWEKRLKDELGLDTVPDLGVASFVAATRPRVEVQPWKYQIGHGIAGMADQEIGIAILGAALLLWIPLGLFCPGRKVRLSLCILTGIAGGYIAGGFMDAVGVSVLAAITAPLVNFFLSNRIAQGLAQAREHRKSRGRD